MFLVSRLPNRADHSWIGEDRLADFGIGEIAFANWKFASAEIQLVCTEVNVVLVRSQVTGQLLDTEFQPTVTATCKAGHMTIRVNLNQSFVGAVHARDFRTPQCMAPGNGSTHATLAINLLAPKGSPDYCGVLVNNVSNPFVSFVKIQSAPRGASAMGKRLITETNVLLRVGNGVR